MNNPLISILLPVYNTSAYLHQCLDSVLAQTYTNLQVVLVDDGSKDNSLEICQQYAVKDSRFEVYHQENQGVATARNVLLSKIKGDYFLFVDSHDWIELNMVEFLVGKALNSQADIVVCGMVNNDGACSEKYKEERMDQETTIKKFLFHKELSGSLWNKLVKTSLLQGIRFDNRISYGEDALFCWHALQRIRTIVQTDRQLYHYRMNENSLSHLNWTPEKKGSGHLVWEAITNETQTLWPQYLDIAKARFAMEDFWGLYYAALCDYPYDEYIKKLQLNIRKNLRLIRKLEMGSKNKIVAAYALSYCYVLGKLLKYMSKRI